MNELINELTHSFIANVGRDPGLPGKMDELKVHFFWRRVKHLDCTPNTLFIITHFYSKGVFINYDLGGVGDLATGIR